MNLNFGIEKGIKSLFSLDFYFFSLLNNMKPNNESTAMDFENNQAPKLLEEMTLSKVVNAYINEVDPSTTPEELVSVKINNDRSFTGTFAEFMRLNLIDEYEQHMHKLPVDNDV